MDLDYFLMYFCNKFKKNCIVHINIEFNFYGQKQKQKHKHKQKQKQRQRQKHKQKQRQKEENESRKKKVFLYFRINISNFYVTVINVLYLNKNFIKQEYFYFHGTYFFFFLHKFFQRLRFVLYSI